MRIQISKYKNKAWPLSSPQFDNLDEKRQTKQEACW